MSNKKLIFTITIISVITYSCAHHSDEKRNPANYLDSFNQIQGSIQNSNLIESKDFLNRTTTLENLEITYGNRSLINIFQSKSNEKVKDHNLLVLSLLKAELETSGDKAGFVTKSESQALTKLVASSRNEKLKRQYDPSGKEGYCYARAILSHVQGIKHDVEPSSIKKIWMVGNVIGYPFHVATMIKGDKGWYILDSSWFPNGGTIEDFIEKFRLQTDRSQKSNNLENMIFIASGDRFAQDSPLKYNPFDFFNTNGHDYNSANDFYRGYFKDFFEDIEKQHNDFFPKRAGKVTEENILNQVEILRRMFDAYPEIYSKENWEFLFDSASSRLEDFLHKSSRKDMSVVLAIEHLRSLSKKLEKDVGHLNQIYKESIIEQIRNLQTTKVNLSLESIKELPIDEIGPYLKEVFSQSKNTTILREAVEYYFQGNIITSKHPLFKELQIAALSSLKQDYTSNEMLLKKLEGVHEDWVIPLLIEQSKSHFVTNANEAINIYKKLPLEMVLANVDKFLSAKISKTALDSISTFLLIEGTLSKEDEIYKKLMEKVIADYKVSKPVLMELLEKLSGNHEEWALKLLSKHAASTDIQIKEVASKILFFDTPNNVKSCYDFLKPFIHNI